MDTNHKDVKRDLLYLYRALYTSVNKGGSSLFDPKLVNKLKHTPETVEHVLEILNEDHSKAVSRQTVKRTEVTDGITNIDELRVFYFSELKKVYDNTLDDELKSKIINLISLSELKRLYSIISNVSIPNNARKKDIIDMLRYFFNDEARSINIAKHI